MPPLARRPISNFYVDSRGVKGFPKIKKLVNMIPAIPDKKIIDLTEVWSRYTRGVTFQTQSWVHLDPWVATGRNQGKAVDFDGSVSKT